MRPLEAQAIITCARVRAPDVPDGLPFACDARFLAGVQILNLVTAHGELDISFRPSGTDGYEDLVRIRSQLVH